MINASDLPGLDDDDNEPAPEYDDSFGDGHCFECGDAFHLDDVGGYNPPCPCCGECRSCCSSRVEEDDDYDDDWWPEDRDADAPDPLAGVDE